MESQIEEKQEDPTVSTVGEEKEEASENKSEESAHKENKSSNIAPVMEIDFDWGKVTEEELIGSKGQLVEPKEIDSSGWKKEIEYEIGAFSSLSFLPAESKEEDLQWAEDKSEAEEEEIDQAALLKEETEAEWNGIIVEEDDRILEVSVTPDQLARFFNGKHGVLEPASTENEEDQESTTEEPATQPEPQDDPETSSGESAETKPRTRVDDDKVQSIIGEFLENEPSVSQPTGRQKQENLAAGSGVEDESLVTETLAIIHAKQGNISKAVKIYERLALIFPEKKSYFADQILKLKK